jgi:hypothetical protein
MQYVAVDVKLNQVILTLNVLKQGDADMICNNSNII